MVNIKELHCIPNGTVELPPSKSIAHRALICASLSNGRSVIKNFRNTGEDLEATLRCMDMLGINYGRKNNDLVVEGGIKAPANELMLDCGESGSTLRFLIPLALLFDIPITFTGNKRLMERPLEEYLEALENNGGEFKSFDKKLLAKGPIKPGTFNLPGNISSQFITGLLLTLPLLEGDSEVLLTTPLESKAYVDLTIKVMKHFNVNIERYSNTRYIIKGNQQYKPCSYTIESDFSAAAFFLVASALGCEVSCSGLNLESDQGDRAILSIIERCGGNIIVDKNKIWVKAETLSPITIDVRDIPDLVPPVAALLCFCDGESRIEGAGRLRMKESDRLHALATQLNGLGANIIEEKDSLIIKGVKELKGGIVDPYNDHRIAMSVAIASIKSRETVKILNPECVNKSYPNFWNDFCKQNKGEI